MDDVLIMCESVKELMRMLVLFLGLLTFSLVALLIALFKAVKENSDCVDELIDRLDVLDDCENKMLKREILDELQKKRRKPKK